MPLFDIQDVHFESRTKEIVRGISMTIEKGSVTALTGKSGSGKSTLLKLIAGLLVPSSGKVLYDGYDIQHMSNHQNMEFRKNCAYVFQNSALWENQTIMQNLELPLLTHHKEMTERQRLERIDEVCAMVNYTRPLNLRPADISMGEQKQIAFARAIINRPRVLFLDECMESLDRKRRVNIIELLKRVVNGGNTIIYVTHDPGFISTFPGTIHVLEEGLLSDYNVSQ